MCDPRRPCRKLPLGRPGALTASLLAAVGLAAGEARAQAPAPNPGQDARALAKQLSNPVSSLVSVPFQANWDHGVADDQMRFLLNFQPVLPFTLTEKTNLITRIVVPILSQPSLAPGVEPAFGLGDVVLSGFFSPAAPGQAIWGLGPVFLLPMSSDPRLGSGKWGMGPTGVLLVQSGSWTYGALANHVWSFAGLEGRSDVNQTFLQPFLAYGTQRGVTFTVNTESTANWEAADGEEWTVPIHLQITKVVRLGRKPLSVGGGAGYYLEKPTGGPDWRIRAILTLLFPK